MKLTHHALRLAARWAAPAVALGLLVSSPRVAASPPGPDGVRADSVRSAWALKGASNGYFVEAAVPWDVVGVRPEAGALVGFDLHVADADEPGYTRSLKLVWGDAPGDDQHRDPSTFGTVRLGGPGAAAAAGGVAEVPQTDAAPMIDADPTDAVWAQAARFPIRNVRLADAAPSPGDLSATARVLWDDRALYVLFDVDDDRIVVDSDDAPYLDDNVEIYVDGDNAKGPIYDGNDLQVQFRPGNAAGRLAPVSYSGRDPSAGWRAEAERRIREHRTAELAVRVVDAAGRPVPGAAVEVRQRRHAFDFGSAVDARWIADTTADGERYRQTVEALYNVAVLENDLKWNPWEASREGRGERYRTAWTDAALDWLLARGITQRGHFLLWGNAQEGIQPQRFFDGAALIADTAAFRAATFDHIREKLAWTRGRIVEWDAVNHPVRPGAPTYGDLYGHGVYADVFRAAREADPSLDLWINEGQVLTGDRTPAYLDVVDGLDARDERPDGVGFMAHFERSALTPPAEVYARLDTFARRGYRLKLTEFDVDVGADEALQADYLRDVMTVAFSHPMMEGVVMWGFWELEHWRPDAALYRADWTIKPAGQAWRDLVFGRWWTVEAGETGADGRFATRGFLGAYAVSARLGDRQSEAALDLDRGGETLTLVLPDATPPARTD